MFQLVHDPSRQRYAKRLPAEHKFFNSYVREILSIIINLNVRSMPKKIIRNIRMS